MKELTPKYRKRLWVIWAIEAVIIVCNVLRPSFATMAFPMAGCWLYVIVCSGRVFAGFAVLFFALLGRMLLFGPYE